MTVPVFGFKSSSTGTIKSRNNSPEQSNLTIEAQIYKLQQRHKEYI